MISDSRDIFEHIYAAMAIGNEANDKIFIEEDPTQHEFMFVLPMHLRGICMLLYWLEVEWHELADAIEQNNDPQENCRLLTRRNCVSGWLESVSSQLSSAVNGRIPARSALTTWAIVRGWRVVLFRDTATYAAVEDSSLLN